MESEIKNIEGVTVDVQNGKVTAKGPKGSLERDFSDVRYDPFINIEKTEAGVKVSSTNERRKIKANVGTIAAHIRNLVLGVAHGYRYKMKVFYTHFPMTVEVKGKEVTIKNFLGEKNLRKVEVVGNVKIEVKKDDITLTGPNIEEVSQTAANIETATRLTGKDRRIFLDGVYMSESGLDKEEKK